MSLFRHILAVAVLAGLAAGLLMSAAHHLGTVPLILKAETYEHAAAHAELTAHAAHGHSHGGPSEAAEWQPAPGAERILYTALADILLGIGFALLLTCLYALRGAPVGWRRGLLWGFAGFLVFTAAPGLGLPPELPGTESAPLLDRQIWWWATAAATAAGLGVLVFGRRPVLMAGGLVLIALPHLFGAPQPAEAVATAPRELTLQFIATVFLTSLFFWAALGALTGYFHDRLRAA